MAGSMRDWPCPIADLRDSVQFTLAFAVVHEFPDAATFFAEVAHASKPDATLLVAEPKGHVKESKFDAELQAAAKSDFAVVERLLSNAAMPPYSKGAQVSH